MFGLLTAAVRVAVELPIAAAADTLTVGGALTDQKKSYTAQSLERVVDDVLETESKD